LSSAEQPIMNSPGSIFTNVMSKFPVAFDAETVGDEVLWARRTPVISGSAMNKSLSAFLFLFIPQSSRSVGSSTVS